MKKIRILTAIKSALEGIEIKATKDNMDRLLGSLQAIDSLIALEQEELDQEQAENDQKESGEENGEGAM